QTRQENFPIQTMVRPLTIGPPHDLAQVSSGASVQAGRRPNSMKRFLVLALIACAFATTARAQNKAQTTRTIPETKTTKAAINNPAIDMEGYLAVANEAAAYRKSRRLTEDEFIQMSREQGTIILDARG